jgi:allantoinase
MKSGDFWRAWGGVAGVQSTLPALLEHGHHRRGLALERIAALLAAEPATRFRIPNRGRVAPGFAADLTLVDLSASFTLKPEDLQQRHPISPYLGQCFRGTVRRTIRRGETIFAGGKLTASGGGTLVRPLRN